MPPPQWPPCGTRTLGHRAGGPTATRIEWGLLSVDRRRASAMTTGATIVLLAIAQDHLACFLTDHVHRRRYEESGNVWEYRCVDHAKSGHAEYSEVLV